MQKHWSEMRNRSDGLSSHPDEMRNGVNEMRNHPDGLLSHPDEMTK